MTGKQILLIVAAVAATSCTAVPPSAVPLKTASGRPLDTLPADADLQLVRKDLIATATDRFGAAAVRQAFRSPSYVIAKRFAGMVPPPPPGAGPDWVAPTPTALLMKGMEGWLVATPDGWRPAKHPSGAELDRLTADPSFWTENALVPPCPDYGASLLLMRTPEHGETVRKSGCTSVAEKAVFAALNA